MNGVSCVMSWTVIKINDDGEVEHLNAYAPHDRNIAIEEIRIEHGSRENPIDGYYVIAIVPGNHPVYN